MRTTRQCDYNKCEREFENVRACKKFWMQVKFARISSKLRPLQPEAADRPALRAEYARTGEVPVMTEAEKAKLRQ